MIRSTISFTVLTLLICCAASASVASASENVSGDWSGVFSIGGHSADVALKFDVNGTKLAGTVYSEHTGPGTVVDGKIEADGFSCTLKFEKHESILLKGRFADDKIAGTFETEGMTGTWTAVRKK